MQATFPKKTHEAEGFSGVTRSERVVHLLSYDWWDLLQRRRPCLIDKIPLLIVKFTLTKLFLRLFFFCFFMIRSRQVQIGSFQFPFLDVFKNGYEKLDPNSQAIRIL